MLEISPDDIALLDDTQLRTVIARLCEAELRKRGFNARHVTWGGNQTAEDGGIDVRVALPAGSVIEGFIPRPSTCFQVKREDMPASKIKAEMRPKGVLRPSVQDVAARSGAYIMVSSQGSTTDSALADRLKSMREAVAGDLNADSLFVEFYDRTRVATWVRSHEALIPWIRTLVGRSIRGWQSYGEWAYDPTGEDAEYLLDEKLRIRTALQTTHQGLTPLQGIEKVRDELRQARRVVRLVGLSGVGKTRFIQALFDQRVGEQSLDPCQVIYTNMADEPDPLPGAMASDLVTARTRMVMVVDNCPSDLHQRLSEICRFEHSRVSVLSVEYDIREDQPEGTEVFKLESSSPELTEKLLRRRFPKNVQH